MKTGAKIAIGCGAALVLASVGTVVGGTLWFQANKDRLKALGTDAAAAGKAYGEPRGKEECLPEALRRLDAASGMLDEVGTKIFFRACLDSATGDPTFCDGVPASDNIMQSVAFALTRCSDAGRANSQPCNRLIQEIQEHCHPSAKTKTAE